MNIIISITQKEAFYLIKKGVSYSNGGIIVTSSRHSGKQYRLVESRENMKMLNNYRNNIKVK